MKKAKGGETIMTCKGSGKKTKVFYKKAKKGEPISTILPDAEYVKFVFTPDLDKDRYQAIIKKLEDGARRKTEEILAYHDKWVGTCLELAEAKEKIKKLESLDKLYPADKKIRSMT